MARCAGDQDVWYVGCEGDGLFQDGPVVAYEVVDVTEVSVVRLAFAEPLSVKVPLVFGCNVLSDFEIVLGCDEDCWLAACGLCYEVVGGGAAVEERDQATLVAALRCSVSSWVTYGCPRWCVPLRQWRSTYGWCARGDGLLLGPQVAGFRV